MNRRQLLIGASTMAMLGACAKMPTGKPLVFIGDSNTLGWNLPGFVSGGALPPDAFSNKLAVALDSAKTILAQAAHLAADQDWLMYAQAPNAGADTVVALCGNDSYWYGADPVKRAASMTFLRNILVWMMTPAKKFARTDCTYTGAWTNTSINSIGRYATGAGNTAMAVVSGTAVYVSCIQQVQETSQGGIDIFVDDMVTPKLTFTPDGVAVGDTINGMHYLCANACVRVGGLAPGPHTVKVVTRDAGKNFFLEYIAGSDQPSRPRAFLSDIFHKTAAAYASGGTSNSDANTDAYNASMTAVVSELQSDGHAIVSVHVPGFDPALHYQPDGNHWNVAGHALVATALKEAISPTPLHTYTPTAAYVREDGLFFIGEGDARKQVLTG